MNKPLVSSRLLGNKILIIGFIFVGLALVLTSFFNVSPLVAAFLLLCPLMHLFMGHGDTTHSEHSGQNNQNEHKH